MKYVIGIDGGGTKTYAVLLDQDGRELGRGRAGGANPNTVGRETSAAAMRRAVQTALMAASGAAETPLTVEDVAGVGVGVAGVTGAQAWLKATVTGVLPRAVVVSGHDAEIALVGALGARRGIVVIGGTGSTVYGVNAAGEDALIDGWGYLLGDESSSYAVGREALRAFLRAHDGRIAPCPLAGAVGAHLGLTARDDIIAWAYGPDRERNPHAHVTEVAELARVVMDLAARGDEMARGIVGGAAEALVLAVKAAWRRLKLGRCEVGLAGGALRWEGALARMAVARLAKALPDVTPVPPRSDAATGAAWLAMHALGWRAL